MRWRSQRELWILWTSVVILILAVLSAGMAANAEKDQHPSIEPEMFRAVILERNGLELIVAREDNKDEAQFAVRVSKHTVLVDATGNKILIQQLFAGQKIEVTVMPLVIYEPITTYTDCQQILLF